MTYQPKSDFQRLNEIAETTHQVVQELRPSEQPWHEKAESTSTVRTSNTIYHKIDGKIYECNAEYEGD